ncbi:DUF1036 domain-containing protein [Faunimonas sp. B44]|uniref:DUF1036 domain-containing protein n=1 Tax=Faunimonas sp. B44 TaxID=3461493 RepID=UPI00404399C8
MLVRTSAIAALLTSVVPYLFSPSGALADLRLCNKTPSRVGVAIGYVNEKQWTTEGWWNIQAKSCETLLGGDLSSRYYYIYAVDYDHGGEWGGAAFMCTRDKEFTIEGVNDCVARGFQRTGFFEVDTGDQTNWTVQLTEPTARGGVGGR